MRAGHFALAAAAALLMILSAGPVRADEDAVTPGSGYGMGPGMMAPGYGMGHGYGRGMGPGMMGRGPEMGYGACYDMGCFMGMGCGHGPSWDEHLGFLDKSRKLRMELHMKMFQYNEALRDPDTSDKELEKIIREMQELRERINEMYMKLSAGEGDGK